MEFLKLYTISSHASSQSKTNRTLEKREFDCGSALHINRLTAPLKNKLMGSLAEPRSVCNRIMTESQF